MDAEGRKQFPPEFPTGSPAGTSAAAATVTAGKNWPSLSGGGVGLVSRAAALGRVSRLSGGSVCSGDTQVLDGLRVGFFPGCSAVRI